MIASMGFLARLWPDDKFRFDYRGGSLPWLNAGKFICAMLVVLIHTDFILKPALLPVCRFAVPFFLMVSGFFLCEPDGSLSPCKIAGIFKKMVVVTVALQMLYYFVAVAGEYLTGPEGFIWNFPTHLRYWSIVIAHGGLFGVHLWYLNSYIWALAILWILVSMRCERFVYYLIIPGLVANLLLGSYLVVGDEPNGGLIRNALVTSLPFLAIGVLLRRNQHLVMSPRRSWLLLLAGLPLLYAESAAISRGGEPLGDLNIVTIPLSVLFFMALLAMPAAKAPAMLVSGGRRLSSHVYYYHKGLMMLLDPLIPAQVIAVAGWAIYAPLSVGVAWVTTKFSRRSVDKVAKPLPDNLGRTRVG